MNPNKDKSREHNDKPDSKEERTKEWKMELAHFDECLKLIDSNIVHYEAEYEDRHEQTKKLFKALQSGDVELYNQLMTSASLEQHAANQLRKNQAARKQPFFGRIDYTEEASKKEECVYIGKNGIFHDRTKVVIADWRAPISSVYYENELGEGVYHSPDGKTVDIDLNLKRTYDIQEGEFRDYYDSDVAANDQLLVQYLSQNKDVVLGDIIATIQKEQNRIIRESPFSNILVQGVAGSGKTTVAMHRISYILYNYKDRFMSNEFCIIGGNDLLLSYITSGLPELDVPDIKQKRMDVMLIHLLGKEWKKKYEVTDTTADAAVRSKITFILELEVYLMHFREKYVDVSPLKDKELGTVLSEENNRRLVAENPDYSVARLLLLLEERMRTRIKFLAPEGEKEYLKKKLAQYKDVFKSRIPQKTIYDIYNDFLSEYENMYPGSIDLKLHGERYNKGKYDVYDLAALLMIQYRITRKKPDEEFGQIFIDEAQDFGITPYYVLRKVLPDCYFTIMGDVSQNINYETGMNDWGELRKWMLTGEKDSFRLLSKSYRNTIEISEYAGKILDKASFGRYHIEPVIRHGLPVQELFFSTEQDMSERASAVIGRANEKGYRSIAVVCRDKEAAERTKERLKADSVTILPIQLVKGLEFDVVLLWNLDMEKSSAKTGEAKLLYVAATRALHELYVLQSEG